LGIGAAALELTILTAARTSEVIGAVWSEISFDNRTWTIPANRMKVGREHRVPLSQRAIGILRVMAIKPNPNPPRGIVFWISI
jgi:integrase